MTEEQWICWALEASKGFLLPSDCKVLRAGVGEEESECRLQGSQLMVLGIQEVPGSADLEY